MPCVHCSHCQAVDRERTARIRAETAQLPNLLAEVALYYAVSVDRLLSRERTQHVGSARMVAYYLAREILTPLGWERLALFFRHDHTTVLHGARVVRGRMAQHPLFAAEVARLRARIEGKAA